MTEIPQVNEKYTGTINEVTLGKGDYVAGGANGMPFLSFENKSKTRPMIAGEVRRYLRDNSPLRVSRSMRDTAYRVLQMKEKLTAEKGREPAVEEIAARGQPN